MPPTLFTDANLLELLRKKEIPPAVLGWNRLEGRPRRHEFGRALRAEVRDPLWFLTRQWQFGEFIANDAGSPALARLEVERTELDLYDPITGDPRAIPAELPLEAVVEREPVPMDLRLRIRLGQQWLALLAGAALSRAYDGDYRTRYAVNVPARTEANASVHAHAAVAQWFAAASGRALDGGALLSHLRGGGDPTDGIAGVDPADVGPLGDLATSFVDWYDALYDEPADASSAWYAPGVEYRFHAAAPEAGGQSVLVADSYGDGHLEWYDFDWAVSGSIPRPPGTPAPTRPTRTISEAIPAPVVFGGMPNARWWEFEDRTIDFGRIDAATTDVAKLLLIEFGLVYSNDWFVLPCRMPVGSVARVTGLSVTNVFGERFWIDPAGRGRNDDWHRWTLFTLDAEGSAGAARPDLFFPATVAKGQDGEPFEFVHLIRDEMANMVWGVENRVLLPHGGMAEGAEAARETLAFARSLVPAAPPAPPSATEAKIRYQIATEVPEHFIPFIPVHVAGSNREIQLQRATMLRIIEGLEPSPRIEPRTELLRPGLSAGQPYFVHEEEVPRAGRALTRHFQRARWRGGRVVLWIGRRSGVGRGEGSSGLAYDRIFPMGE